jgi:hypothetical protein
VNPILESIAFSISADAALKGQNHEIKRRSRRRPLELAALFMGATIHLKQFGATQATLDSYTAVMCCEEPHHCKQKVCSGITLK